MKVYANQLPRQLDQGLHPVYLVFGDEPLQKLEAIDAIRQAAQRQGFAERETLSADPQFDWNDLFVAFNSLSLFSSQKLIELEIDKGKPGQQGGKVLNELAKQFNQDTILLIHGGKIGAEVQKAKWFKTLQSQGVFVPLYNIEGEQFNRWIRARCQQAQIQLEPQGVSLLASFYSGNLLGAAQEIEKLSISHPQQQINTDYLQSVILNQSRFTVFMLVDQLLAGQIDAAINILVSLQHEGLEATIVSWALTREILQLYEMQTLIQGGMSVSQVMQQFRVWSSRQSLVGGALSRLSAAQLEMMIGDLNTIDSKLKSSAMTQPYVDLCHVCLSFAFAEQLAPYPLATVNPD